MQERIQGVFIFNLQPQVMLHWEVLNAEYFKIIAAFGQTSVTKR